MSEPQKEYSAQTSHKSRLRQHCSPGVGRGCGAGVAGVGVVGAGVAGAGVAGAWVAGVGVAVGP